MANAVKEALKKQNPAAKGKQHGKVQGEFKVDTTKGSVDGTVSNNWMSRPEDQRYTSLSSLESALNKRQANMQETVVRASTLDIDVTKGQPTIKLANRRVGFTNYGFGYLAYLADAPASYLRKLPADLAAPALQHGLRQAATGDVKIYHDDDRAWAFTSPKYGRIYDADVVRAVRKVAGNGTGDTNWKIPGMLDWGKGTYNPYVDPTKDTTTLYASDHDVFMFLVDDTHPIEVGKLADGAPDLVFRGFYVWNSEVGARSFGISTFYLRGVCCNRNLWGVEDQITTTIRHTAHAPERFVEEAGPALAAFATASAKPLIAKVKAAKELILIKKDEERQRFFMSLGLTKAQATAATVRGIEEEGHAPASAWDVNNALSALARLAGKTDERLILEKKAALVMEKVKA